MLIKPKFLFILIGNDRTGKTSLQKYLIDKLCGLGWYNSLHCNKKFNITHPNIKRKYQDISFGNRSYQEKVDDYGTVKDYFDKHFNPADISFISSHLVFNDVKEMIRLGRRKYYNVIGVFWTNSIHDPRNEDISELDWNERLIIENPIVEDKNQEKIYHQLDLIAENFVDFIISRTTIS